VSTSIRTTFLHPRTLIVNFTAFHTGSSKSTSFLGCRAIPLLHQEGVLEELTASQAFVVFLGEQSLKETETKIGSENFFLM
jgi:hypothetical protein